MKDTVCIVGSHPQTRELVPWGDDTCDIWTINEEFGKPDTWVKRCDAILQMHPKAIWDNPLNRNHPEHGQWLRTQDKCDVWMLEQFPEVPRCRKYPLKEIAEKYLSKFTINIGVGSHKEFLQTSAAFALPLAMYLGYKRVRIYGIELVIESEYRYQRPSFMFWFGLMLGAGIEVEYNGYAFQGKLYGYEADGDITRDDLEGRRNELIGIIGPKQAEYLESLKTLGDAMARWVADGKQVDADIIENGVRACVEKMNNYAIFDGGKQHIEMYLKRADEMIAVGNEARFSHHEFERDAQAILKQRENEILAYSVNAGKADAMWTALKKEIAQSRRRRGMLEFDAQVKAYLQSTAKVAIFTGAIAEAQRLQKIIREMMIRAIEEAQ